MLKEKALAKDPDLEKLTRWGLAREARKEDAHHLKGSNIRRLDFQKDVKINNEEIDDMIESLQNTKLETAAN